MLQTVTAKSETAPVAQPKEKDASAEELSAGLGSFLAQFMAAMPAPTQAVQNLKPTDNPAPERSTEPARTRAAQASQAQAAQTQASRAERKEPVARKADMERPDADAASAPADRGGTAAQDPQTTSANDATQPLPSAQQAQAQSKAGQAQAAETTQAAPTAPGPAAPSDPAKAATPEGIAVAKAQAALEQAQPGTRVQFQFPDQTNQATSKPALSELLNQVKVPLQTPNFEGVAGATATDPGAALPGATPAVAGAMPQVSLTATELALVTQTPAKEVAIPAPLSNNFSAAEAVGAGAAPGATTSVRVTASAAADPGQALKRDNPMTQVDSSIRWLIKNKDQSAELQLHPESLGRVQIKITVEGDQVHAKLWASEASAMPVLQEHRAFLETSLKAQGLTLGSFDLQHGQQSQQSPLPNPESSAALPSLSPERAEIGQETPSPTIQLRAGSHRIEIVA